MDGATALFMASESGHLEIVKMLLDGDADPGVMGPRGRRAVDVAVEGGHPRIVALLKGAEEERGAYAKARELDTVAGYDAFLGVVSGGASRGGGEAPESGVGGESGKVGQRGVCKGAGGRTR